jgi:hypothetical protein
MTSYDRRTAGGGNTLADIVTDYFESAATELGHLLKANKTLVESKEHLKTYRLRISTTENSIYDYDVLLTIEGRQSWYAVTRATLDDHNTVKLEVTAKGGWSTDIAAKGLADLLLRQIAGYTY